MCCPGSTYISLKTATTTALLFVCTTLKPKVQGSNPARDIFSSHRHVYVLMLACGSTEGAIICNSAQLAHRGGTPPIEQFICIEQNICALTLANVKLMKYQVLLQL